MTPLAVALALASALTAAELALWGAISLVRLFRGIS